MIVRKGEKKDIPQVLDLIKELAIYEHSLHEVINSTEQMEIDGFGPNQIFGFLVAVEYGKVIGTAIYFQRYSTWKGKRLYLEDIIVTESRRREGIGKMLFDQVIQIARETQCTGMMWQVLEWNEPAINFYKKHYNATLDGEWLNCHLNF